MAKKEYRELTVSEARGCRAGIPALRIQGLWFRQLGFDIGDPVLVECEDGKIIITKDEALQEQRAAEKAFLEAKTHKLELKVAEEKKRLRQMCVADREARYEV